MNYNTMVTGLICANRRILVVTGAYRSEEVGCDHLTKISWPSHGNAS